MNNTSKMCLLCCRKLVGRSDKKFCNDACRNDFNNRLNSDENNLMRRINYALRKNRRILQEFLIKNKTSLTRQELSAAGFDFEFCTSTQLTAQGIPTFRVYEMGYKISGKMKIDIFSEDTQGTDQEVYNRRNYPFTPAFA